MYEDFYFLAIPERLCESTVDIFFSMLDFSHSKVVYLSQAHFSEAFLSVFSYTGCFCKVYFFIIVNNQKIFL